MPRRFPIAAALLIVAGAAVPPAAPGQTIRLDPQRVTATRTAQPVEQIAATIRLLDADALRHAPTLTLDAALRSVPGFSLFRRSDSLTANPTAQGVSLRGLGPSGASRSLVLLDDVPLNDPFGGWVAWTKVPREGLARAELLPGGGATAWGNAALGGIVQLLSDSSTRTAPSLVAGAGDYGTRTAELSLSHQRARDGLNLRGRIFSTDGFRLVAPERRGPIDIPAWSRHRWMSGGWRHEFSPALQLAVTARSYEEKRGNGTPYQRNSSREKFASAHAAGANGARFSWQAAGYAQDQSFASTFSAVNASRTAETPASDQFDVPATAFGAAWTGTWSAGTRADSSTSAGFDARRVTGETRENFTFANGDFTRQRIAGGRQDVAGLFVAHEHPLGQNVRASVGLRGDAWRDTDGHRRETDRLTNAVLRDDRYADRDGTAVSPSLGLLWLSHSWRIHANAQRAFRRPTLNELYRPFRVGPNVTEANAALGTERATSAELGAKWSVWSQKPEPVGLQVSPHGRARRALALGAVAFWNDLEDAVGNVTLARGPGTFPIVGFIAAGGVGRQRLNLDRTRVRGLELSATYSPTTALSFTADFLYNDARVTASSLAPALVGKRLAQVPRHSASLGATLQAPAKLVFTPRVRWLGRQFEDDENQLVLGEVVIADLNVSRRLNDWLELFFTCENVTNARIETGRTADGIVNLGTPRLFLAGVRGTW